MEFLLVWFAAVMVNILLAEKKNLSTVLWAILGAFFGFLSTLILLVVPAGTVGLVRCPACAEAVKAEARVCKHCATPIR